VTLQQCIDQYHAAWPAAPVTALTVLGDAVIAARRFALALRELPPEDREHLLAEVVVGAEDGSQKCGFSLLVSRPLTPDPEVA
jgi:hypothetical protein